jgi:hypothetical protein
MSRGEVRIDGGVAMPECSRRNECWGDGDWTSLTGVVGHRGPGVHAARGWRSSDPWKTGVRDEDQDQGTRRRTTAIDRRQRQVTSSNKQELAMKIKTRIRGGEPPPSTDGDGK